MGRASARRRCPAGGTARRVAKRPASSEGTTAARARAGAAVSTAASSTASTTSTTTATTSSWRRHCTDMQMNLPMDKSRTKAQRISGPVTMGSIVYLKLRVVSKEEQKSASERGEGVVGISRQ